MSAAMRIVNEHRIAVSVAMVFLAVTGMARVTSGATLSYEGFDYTIGQPLNTQSGGTGWGTNAWSAPGTYAIVSGLTFSDYGVTGEAVQINFPSSNNSQQVANRQVSATTNPTTLWRSYLYRPDSTVNNNYNGLQVNASTTNVNAAVMRSANRGWSHARGGVGVDNGVTWGSQDFTDGTTHLVVSKFTWLNTNSVTGKWWSLRPAEYDAIKAGGITETELDTASYDTATESVTFGSALSFDTSKYVQMQFVTGSGTSQSVTYDEIRHGEQLADLFPGMPVPPPESAVAQIDFTNGASPAGWNQAGVNSTITPLADPTGAPTDISMETLNAFGWTWNQGPNSDQTAPNGVVFPAAVSYRNAGDNTHHSGRDSFGVIRLSSPTQYDYELTFLSAFTTNPGITQFNVGGTWNPTTMSFDGGTTVQINPDINDPSPKTGTISVPSVLVGGAYVVDLQVGNTVGGTTVGGMNGLHVRANPVLPVPEPATMLAAGLALGALGGYLRRRRRN